MSAAGLLRFPARPSRWRLRCLRACDSAPLLTLTIAHPRRLLQRRRLLPDRKLRSFDQQPLADLASDPPAVRSERLGYYFLEDAIKQRYERFVTASPFAFAGGSSPPPRLVVLGVWPTFHSEAAQPR